MIFNTPLQSSLTCAVISALYHWKNYARAKMEKSKVEPGKRRIVGGGSWRKEWLIKTSIHLLPNKSRKRSLAFAVTRCTNNEYNLEVPPENLCELERMLL